MNLRKRSDDDLWEEARQGRLPLDLVSAEVHRRHTLRLALGDALFHAALAALAFWFAMQSGPDTTWPWVTGVLGVLATVVAMRSAWEAWKQW